MQGHTLGVYRSSERADSALRELAGAARERGRRVTVLALVTEEQAGRGCCDTRSVLWNRIEREMAGDDLTRARLAVDDAGDVELGVLVHDGRRVAEAVAREAARRGADEIVLADPRSSGLTRRQRRALGA